MWRIVAYAKGVETIKITKNLGGILALLLLLLLSILLLVLTIFIPYTFCVVVCLSMVCADLNKW